MGARFTKYQPFVPVQCKGGLITLKDLFGRSYNIQIPLNFSVEEDTTEFFENIFMRLVNKDFQLILRYNMTWSLITISDGLLLDIGSYKFENREIFYAGHEHIGYMSVNGNVSPVLLNTDNRKLIHGILDGDRSNGYDFILKRPLPDIEFGTGYSQSLALNNKSKLPKMFLCDEIGKVLEVEYNVFTRSFQI